MADIFRKEYKPLSPELQQLMDDIKDGAQKLHELIGRAESEGTAGTCIQTSQRRLEEAVMWAIKGITS